MSQSPPPVSKLFIRSEVLSVIKYLSVVEAPSKLERSKQIKRLATITNRATVLEILVKELQRMTSNSGLQAVTELLMELGDIKLLQDPLWMLIEGELSRDEVKDAANLVLRHLGDDSDPDLYLDYLEDPQGLINRETERMLEVASRNPEALIDFIDFVFSLPVGEQVSLLESLQQDYEPEHLLNIYIPTFLAVPPLEVKECILKGLANISSERCAVFLDELQTHYDAGAHMEPSLNKLLKKAVNTLRLAGVYRLERLPEYRSRLAKPYPLLSDSVVARCFVTLADGIGNQGVVVSRRQRNGDMMMMSVAVNDLHGIIDCFGFFQLSESDFGKISEKFHEDSAKISVPASYCRAKLEAAESLTKDNHNRVPYEYTCWKVLLADIEEDKFDLKQVCRELADTNAVETTQKLYCHSDFSTWFLEEGDHPVVTEVLVDVAALLTKAAESKTPEADFLSVMEQYGQGLAQALLTTDWKRIIISRLADSAYLFKKNDMPIYASLAATEVIRLADCAPDNEVEVAKVGFIRQFGRRCIEEHLLRLKHDPAVSDEATPYVEALLATWDVSPIE